MKKLRLILLFPLLLCFSCSSSSLPFHAGDSMRDLGRYLPESVEWHSRNSFTFFQYNNRSYMMTEAPYSNVIARIESYSTKLPSMYDFFQLTPFMNIYDAAKIVGVPYELAQTSTFWVIYHTKEGKQVNVSLTEYCGYVYYCDQFFIYDPK